MKVGLWIGPAGCHTLRFDEVDAGDIAHLMRSVGYHQPVQVSDYRRNILGTWQAGELRDAAELCVLTEGHRREV
jgi:hypothetical protein